MILRDAAVTRQVGHHRLALGDGAGLIHDHHIDAVGGLQSLCGLDQNAVGRAPAGAYHDGSRSSQSQRTGAGDHQYRYRDGHGELKGRAADQPYHHSKNGDADDDWHKNSGHLVGQFGNGATVGDFNGVELKVYDRERTICDCFKYRSKLDNEIFNKAINAYVADPKKNLANLSKYAKDMGVYTKLMNVMEVLLNG